MLPDFGGVIIDRRTFAREVIADRPAEGGIGNVVRRPCQSRLEPATHLVLALGARLEAPDAPLDAELDPLVITGLEMQAVVLGSRAPIAPVERLGLPEEYGGGDGCLALP